MSFFAAPSACTIELLMYKCATPLKLNSITNARDKIFFLYSNPQAHVVTSRVTM